MPPDNRKDDKRWPLIAILVLAALLRFPSLRLDLPFVYDADEPTFVNAAVSMLRNRDLNPHWFGAPAGTTIYTLAVLYGALYAGGRVAGRFHSAEDFRELFHTDPTALYAIGRAVSSLFSLGSVLLTYLIARRLASQRAALFAALVVAITPPEINLSLLVRMDSAMAFFLLAGFWFCLDILEGPDQPDRAAWKSYAAAGVCLGLGVASKYPAAVFCIIIVLAHVMAWRSRRVWLLLVAGAASLAAAFVVSPFLFLDFRSVLHDVLVEARPDHLGAGGRGFFGNFARYLTESLPNAISWTGIGLTIAASLVALRQQSGATRKRPVLLLAAFALVFTAFVASLNLWWDRWFLPVIPAAAILVAVACDRIVAALSPRTGRLMFAAACTVVLAPVGYRAWMLERELSGPHTRTLAREWILAHIPAGSRVLVESADPYLPYSRYQLFEVPAINPSGVAGAGEIGSLQAIPPPDRGYRAEHEPEGIIGQLKDIDDLRRERIQYVVVGNFFGRYAAERERYPGIVKTYQSIMGMGERLWEVEPSPGASRGGRVEVYRLE